MTIDGVFMVRDGIDTIRVCVLHALSLGPRRIWVVDYGSSDGTAKVLARLARKVPVSWSSDPGSYRQHEVVTGLVHEASAAGADWVVPLDHDEFHFAPGELPAALAALSPEAAAAQMPLVGFVQRRAQRRSSPAALLTMTYRPAATIEPVRAQELVEQGRISSTSTATRPSSRSAHHARVKVQRGAHWAIRLDGPVAPLPGVELLHAPIPSLQALARKAEHGERLAAAGYVEREGWHVLRWAEMRRDGRLAEDWVALSYNRGGRVEVGGERRPLLGDDPLARLVARWIRPSHRQWAARAARRSFQRSSPPLHEDAPRRYMKMLRAAT